MKPTFAILISAFTLLTSPIFSDACSCVQPRVETSFFASKKVVIGKVLSVSDCAPGSKPPCAQPEFDGKKYYTVLVRRSYKGCLEPSTKIVVNTPSSSGLCGVFLSIGENYLLNINENDGIFLCNYNRRQKDLTKEDLKFLNMQLQCCKRYGRLACRCGNGSAPINCLVDPCSVSKPPCEEAKVCKSNYCGGCNAVWFKEGGEQLACLPSPF
eukprot:Plantae.Rhodophyta-Hildenbrandia_rubra.ctg1857.p1 GENE.Plantae.Rhodophyta-Hildenbrandia_rubra.ctg1857~~Plantae.Rhodophyta-Hildenbrandia_rubra.ctg1857.p1  ORF type:complete len:212 (-),score=14.18 Plantae.Rhodophyta-Hildenbrandia_rubra.ctg1857:145-780(-)